MRALVLALALALVLALTGTLGCGPAVGGRQLSGAEITLLFADHTVEGHHEVAGYDFRSYYAADGTFRSHQSTGNATPKAARWWVAKDDICIDWEASPGPLCRIMVESGGRYRKVLVLPRRAKTVVSYSRFTPGNPGRL